MPNCSVVIFDRQGRKVFESQPYNNDWKALTPGGGQLPAGPYYFIIKCDNEVAKTGSVLVVR
jgi:gliding motility-associated-like protein